MRAKYLRSLVEALECVREALEYVHKVESDKNPSHFDMYDDMLMVELVSERMAEAKRRVDAYSFRASRVHSDTWASFHVTGKYKIDTVDETNSASLDVSLPKGLVIDTSKLAPGASEIDLSDTAEELEIVRLPAARDEEPDLIREFERLVSAECTHKWTRYEGLSGGYEFCEHCPSKRNKWGSYEGTAD